MAEPATKEETDVIMSDWSLLNRDLLDIISKYLDNCFDVIHARSVCRHWRSTFPFPERLLRSTYSLPFPSFPILSSQSCTLEKIPLFLLRKENIISGYDSSSDTGSYSNFPCEYFMGWISPDEIPSSPLQCCVNVKIRGFNPKLINVLECHIFSLGHQYRMIDVEKQKEYRGVAVLPLDKEGGEEFVVLYNYYGCVLALRSSEMNWMSLEDISLGAKCENIVVFKGKFYANFHNGDIFVIDPYSLQETPLLPPEPNLNYFYNFLVPSDDEIFLVELVPPQSDWFEPRLSRLDQEAGIWVEELIDSRDCVLFIGMLGHFSCSAKELRYGYGFYEKTKSSPFPTRGPEGSKFDWFCICL